MMIFRRSIFFAIAATMFVAGLLWVFTVHTFGFYAAFLGDCWVGSPLAMLVWCAGFLNVEPTLARAGIVGYLVFVSVMWFIPITN